MKLRVVTEDQLPDWVRDYFGPHIEAVVAAFLETLPVMAGRIPEFRVYTGWLQWKYTDEPASGWRQLLNIASWASGGTFPGGRYAGSFATKNELPLDSRAFPNSITTRDYVIIRTDETHENLISWYIVSAIDEETNVITWTYDMSLRLLTEGAANEIIISTARGIQRSGKRFVTSIDDSATDDEVPTAKAIANAAGSALKQDKITGISTSKNSHLLTAPLEIGGQPGSLPVSDFAVAAQGIKADNAVQYVAQSLMTVQQTQARNNIAAYTKPTAGIPKADLDAAVQTSVNKADSALQSFTETDPVYTAEKPTIALKYEVTALQTLISNLKYVKNIEYNDTSGDVTFTFENNSTLRINVFADNLAQAIDYNSAAKKLEITKRDGTLVQIDVSDLVDIYMGSIGTHIQVIVDTDNVIHAVLKAGTVTETELAQALKDKIDGKQSALNRTVTGNDNATGTTNDTGNNLSIPVPVTILAITDSSTQVTGNTASRTLRSYIQTIVNNLANLFSRIGTAETNLSSKADAAHSHSWAQITSPPTIPAAANDGMLTIQRYGVQAGTFTANQGTNTTINMTAPAWDEVTGKPTTFLPGTHTHTEYAALTHSHSDKANDADVVKLTGNQTIAGKKSFGSTNDAATVGAGFALPHRTIPGTIADGDIWTTTAGLFIRVNGATQTLVNCETAQTFTGKKTFGAAADTAATAPQLNLPHRTNSPTSLVNGDLWTTAAGLFARINGESQNLSVRQLTQAQYDALSVTDKANGTLYVVQESFTRYQTEVVAAGRGFAENTSWWLVLLRGNTMNTGANLPSEINRRRVFFGTPNGTKTESTAAANGGQFYRTNGNYTVYYGSSSTSPGEYWAFIGNTSYTGTTAIDDTTASQNLIRAIRLN
jgi:hypothetical protein